MTATPVPFVSLAPLRLYAAPSVSWSQGISEADPAVAIVDLGGARVFTYSEAQAAALEAAFAQARRMHAAGGQS